MGGMFYLKNGYCSFPTYMIFSPLIIFRHGVTETQEPGKKLKNFVFDKNDLI